MRRAHARHRRRRLLFERAPRLVIRAARRRGQQRGRGCVGDVRESGGARVQTQRRERGQKRRGVRGIRDDRLGPRTPAVAVAFAPRGEELHGGDYLRLEGPGRRAHQRGGVAFVRRGSPGQRKRAVLGVLLRDVLGDGHVRGERVDRNRLAMLAGKTRGFRLGSLRLSPFSFPGGSLGLLTSFLASGGPPLRRRHELRRRVGEVVPDVRRAHAQASQRLQHFARRRRPRQRGRALVFFVFFRGSPPGVQNSASRRLRSFRDGQREDPPAPPRGLPGVQPERLVPGGGEQRVARAERHPSRRLRASRRVEEPSRRRRVARRIVFFGFRLRLFLVARPGRGGYHPARRDARAVHLGGERGGEEAALERLAQRLGDGDVGVLRGPASVRHAPARGVLKRPERPGGGRGARRREAVHRRGAERVVLERAHERRGVRRVVGVCGAESRRRFLRLCAYFVPHLLRTRQLIRGHLLLDPLLLPVPFRLFLLDPLRLLGRDAQALLALLVRLLVVHEPLHLSRQDDGRPVRVRIGRVAVVARLLGLLVHLLGLLGLARDDARESLPEHLGDVRLDVGLRGGARLVEGEHRHEILRDALGRLDGCFDRKNGGLGWGSRRGLPRRGGRRGPGLQTHVVVVIGQIVPEAAGGGHPPAAGLRAGLFQMIDGVPSRSTKCAHASHATVQVGRRFS